MKKPSPLLRALKQTQTVILSMSEAKAKDLNKILRSAKAGLRITILLFLLPLPLYAMNAAGPHTRDEIIDVTMNGLGSTTEQPKGLAPIKVNLLETLPASSERDALLIAKALHLYNQRRLTEAKSDLSEIAVNNPDNQAAAVYLTKVTSKIAAAMPPRRDLDEQAKGIMSVQNAKMGGIHGIEEPGSMDGAERFTTDTAGIIARISKQGEDQTNKFIAEGLKLEGSMNDYKYTATANINYYNNDNKREDVRLRNATWWMKNEKVQLIAGDTSSNLSRYILNGVNYRGINAKLDLYQNMFGDIKDNVTLLYGKIPYFYLTTDRYIYPRQLVGARNEAALWNWWNFNTTFAYIVDSPTRMTKIDTNDKAKENGLLGIDQSVKLIPDIWTLSNETAFSYGNDDRSSDPKILRSWATYFVSDFKLKMVKLYNSYERIEPEFRSFTGLTGFSGNRQVTIDREHILNFLDYTPLEWMDLGLQFSQTRTNLDKSDDVETIKEQNYKANLKIMPINELPRFSLRGSVWTSKSEPGMLTAPNDESSWDTVFEVAKTVRETDLSASYGLRQYGQFINDTNSYGDALEQVFTLSANRKLFDNFEVTPSYSLSRARLLKMPNRPLSTDSIISQLFDLHLSAGLWDTAHLTLDYNLSRAQDFATGSIWGTTNAFTTAFSWPFTTNIGINKKFVFSPYLSYHYADGAALLDRSYFAAKLDGDYFLTDNSKLNISGEYRGNKPDDPVYAGFGDEFRIMLAYKTVNGF